MTLQLLHSEFPYIVYEENLIFFLSVCLSGPSEPAECCGSRIAFGNATVPTGAFHRLVAGPAFYLGRGVPLTADLSPPNRVLDLRLTAAHNDALTVDLAWTAPGGDYDFGKGETRFFFSLQKAFCFKLPPLYLPYFSSLEYKFIIICKSLKSHV
jgi:hypothetical protein